MPKPISTLKRYSFLLTPETIAALHYLTYYLARSGGTNNMSAALRFAILDTAAKAGYKEEAK